jgi:hypothetical protein
MGAGDQSAAWEAYYRQQAEQGQQPQAEYPTEYGVSPYPPQQGQQQGQRSTNYGQGQGQGQVDGVTQQMGRMGVHGQ